MWPFGKKSTDPTSVGASPDSGDEGQKGDFKVGDGKDYSGDFRKIGVEITKILAKLDSFSEVNKSTSERFSTINEQMGELRGQLMDTNRNMGQLEVKATKAADLVESVHPDKLMIQVQKLDGKIEGVRAGVESKDAMIANIMEQLRGLRNSMMVFKGIEQVVKLNEEVKSEILSAKKILANVERHADRVENVFVESQKSFQEFNDLAGRFDSFRSDIKDLNDRFGKAEAKIGTFIVRRDFETRVGHIESHDKRMKQLLDDIEESWKKLDAKFELLRGSLVRDFDRKIFRAEMMSKAFEDLLAENPLFAKGLDLEKYVEEHLDEIRHSGMPQTPDTEPKDTATAQPAAAPEDIKESTPEKAAA